MDVIYHLRRIFKLIHYSGYNLDFIWRLLLIELWSLFKFKTNIKFFQKYDIHIKRYLSANRGYYFNTPFGIFFVKSVDEWSAMYDDYESYVQQIFKNNIEKYKNIKNKIFLDIGSNIGRYAIPLALKGYKVYAFEPAEPIFKKLQKNVKLNNLDGSITLIPYALSDVEDECEFEYFDYSEGSSRVLKYKDVNSKYSNILNIRTKKLDDIVREYKIPIEDIKLIKIDVEGHELNVIKGGINTFKKLEDVDIVMEIFENNPYKEKTLDLMKSLGYESEKISKNDWHFWK